MTSEATWTQPTDECPNPELWHARDSESTEREICELVGAIVVALQPEYVVETGSAYGQTARTIGEALRSNGHGRLVTLEIDPKLVSHTRAVVQGLPVEVLEMSSMEWEPEEQIGFAWFDSLTPLRVQEFHRYSAWMTTRTVVGFHDTGEQHQPLRSQIEDLWRDGAITEPLFLPTPRGCCFARVR